MLYMRFIDQSVAIVAKYVYRHSEDMSNIVRAVTFWAYDLPGMMNRILLRPVSRLCMSQSRPDAPPSTI